MAVATELQKGSYFMMNSEPVRVTRKEVVAVGTHSHSKLKIFYQGLKDKGEKTVNLSHTDKVEILDIIRKQGQIISKSHNAAQLMDMVTYETLDANASPEIFNELKEGDVVTFIELYGKIQILEKR